MVPDDTFEYTVVLVFPGYGSERENAEEIIEEALEYLNTHTETPGFRFKPGVSATLEIVSDIENAEEKLCNDPSVAMVILHDVPEDEKKAFTRQCVRRNVAVCLTTPGGDEVVEELDLEPGKPREWKLVIKKRSGTDDGSNAHQITVATLTATLEQSDEKLMDRVWQLIAVMALGVMQHHWREQPPRFPPFE